MLKLIFIVAAFYCLAFLCSCQKEIAVVTDPPPVTTDIPAGESYIPLTTGTFWVYQDSASGGTDTATVLADEWLNNNITFRKVQIVNAADESFTYYGILDHNYYIYGEQSGINITMLVLNDLADDGSSWVYDMGMINGVPARGTGTIIEKDISFAVQGQTYQNVIHSRYVMAYNILGTYVDFATYDFYFAKGIGVIKVQAAIADGMGGFTTSTQDLIDYTVE